MSELCRQGAASFEARKTIGLLLAEIWASAISPSSSGGLSAAKCGS
jgi:hypothetical protein